MKFSIFIFSFLVGSAGAHAADISDSIDLADYTNAKGKALGASGTLTVNLSSVLAEAYISFFDYESEEVCTEYSEPAVPRHPETAECLKFETHWKPVVNLNFISPFFTAYVGEVKVNLAAASLARVNDSCFKNLSSLIVVGNNKPVAPAAITINKSCSAMAYSNNRGISIKPRVLRGQKLEVVIVAGLKTNFVLNQDLLLQGAQPVMLPYEALTHEIQPSQVDLSSSLFQYDARLFVK